MPVVTQVCDELEAFAEQVEAGLQEDFPHLHCAVQVRRDPATGEPIPELVFDVRHADGTKRFSTTHPIDGRPADDEEAIFAFVGLVGTRLERRLRSTPPLRGHIQRFWNTDARN